MFEEIWPRVWLLIGLAAVFVLISMLGVWQGLSDFGHTALLSLFALVALAILVWIARVRIPTRAEAVRRVERASGVAHRPASSYEEI